MRQLIGIIIAIGMAGIAPPFIIGIDPIGMEVIAALMKVLRGSAEVARRLYNPNGGDHSDLF